VLVQRASATAILVAVDSTSSCTQCPTGEVVEFVSIVDTTPLEDTVINVSRDITETSLNQILILTSADVRILIIILRHDNENYN